MVNHHRRLHQEKENARRSVQAKNKNAVSAKTGSSTIAVQTM
jgi:hypothetical protein